MGFFIGFDIGGTNVRSKVYSQSDNSVIFSLTSPLKRCDTVQQEVEINICDTIESLFELSKINIGNLKGIGLSLAAICDRRNGNVINWPNNRKWNGFPIRKYIAEKYKVPVVIEDDANSAAVGEHIMGSAKGCANFAYITVSTGIGCGLILNNKLYIGTNGFAGEIGHIKVSEKGPICTCGAIGCLQSFASGPGILRRSIELANEYKVAIDGISELEQVSLHAENGKLWAVKAFEEAAHHLAYTIYFIALTLDISLFVIGGGVTKAGSVFFNTLERKLESIIEHTGRKINIKPAKLGDESGVIGALNLIYKYVMHGDGICMTDR